VSSNGHPGKVSPFRARMVSQFARYQFKSGQRASEELWNQVIEKHFRLAALYLCPWKGEDDHIPQGLLDLHSQSIERGSL